MNQVLNRSPNNLKKTETDVKTTEIKFMLKLKTIVAKRSTEPNLNCVKATIRSERRKIRAILRQDIFKMRLDDFGNFGRPHDGRAA